MLVYRVEDDEGGGPYRGDNHVDGMGSKHTDSDHPAPCDDGLPFLPPDYMNCGFASLSQFKAWFDQDDRWDLKVNGFRLRIFKADVVDHGEKQVMFHRGRARLVETRDVVSLRPIPATGAPAGLLEC
jgi:hypothetical protein